MRGGWQKMDVEKWWRKGNYGRWHKEEDNMWWRKRKPGVGTRRKLKAGGTSSVNTQPPIDSNGSPR